MHLSSPKHPILPTSLFWSTFKGSRWTLSLPPARQPGEVGGAGTKLAKTNSSPGKTWMVRLEDQLLPFLIGAKFGGYFQGANLLLVLGREQLALKEQKPFDRCFWVDDFLNLPFGGMWTNGSLKGSNCGRYLLGQEENYTTNIDLSPFCTMGWESG